MHRLSSSRIARDRLIFAGVAFLVWVFFVLGSRSPKISINTASIKSPPVPAEALPIVAALKSFRSAHRNAQITGKTTIRGADETTGAFTKDLGGCEFTEVVDLLGTGKTRIDFPSFVSEWEEGSAPFYERRQSISYNGASYIVATQKEGPRGRMYSVNEVTIGPNLPSILSICREQTIDHYLLPLTKVFDHESVLATLDPPPPSTRGPLLPTVLVYPEKLDDRDLLCVDVKDLPKGACSQELLYLDPTRAFLLVKRIRKWNLCGNPSLVQQWDSLITEAQQIAPDLWFPMVMQLTRSSGGKPVERLETKVDSVVLDLPESDALFEAIPETSPK